ncbi:MAG TPA: F0F1 ATP synthase subunit B [Gammaproteobacteria bacterium]
MDLNWTLVGQTIAMIVFVWACMKYIWPPIMGAIEARQATIAEGLAAAERGRSDLAAAKDEAQKIVAAARDQARGIIDQANARAAEIVEQARAAGEAEKKRLLEGARAEIDVEINRARDELRRQVAVLAIAGAEQVLGREIDPNNHRELLDRLAAEL